MSKIFAPHLHTLAIPISVLFCCPCINVCARVHVCATLTMIVRQATAPVHVVPVAQLVVLVTSYTLHTHTWRRELHWLINWVWSNHQVSLATQPAVCLVAVRTNQQDLLKMKTKGELQQEFYENNMSCHCCQNNLPCTRTHTENSHKNFSSHDIHVQVHLAKIWNVKLKEC